MSINLITPSYWRDFEQCRLLCDTVDTYVTGYDRHLIVVAPEDLALFSSLAGPRREIVNADDVVPVRLWSPPVRWRGRRYFWGAGLAAPVYGWHLQQVRKIGITLAQDAERAMHLDSDVCFIRPYDVGPLAEGPLPLACAPGAIDERLPRHVHWHANAYRALGLTPPPLPGDDFISPMVVWERASVAAMVARIGADWPTRLLRLREFSEYLLYGAAVTTDPALMARHRLVPAAPCKVYWDGPALDRAGLEGFMAGMDPAQVAIMLQSFTQTPAALVRDLVLAAAREAVA
jgi:hypothetical protein